MYFDAELFLSTLNLAPYCSLHSSYMYMYRLRFELGVFAHMHVYVWQHQLLCTCYLASPVPVPLHRRRQERCTRPFWIVMTSLVLTFHLGQQNTCVYIHFSDTNSDVHETGRKRKRHICFSSLCAGLTLWGRQRLQSTDALLSRKQIAPRCVNLQLS